MFCTHKGAKGGNYLAYIVLASPVYVRPGLPPASTILPKAQGDVSFYSHSLRVHSICAAEASTLRVHSKWNCPSPLAEGLKWEWVGIG